MPETYYQLQKHCYQVNQFVLIAGNNLGKITIISKKNFIFLSFANVTILCYVLGISRLKGTTLYELYLTQQQRGLNWKDSNEKSNKDVLSAFKVWRYISYSRSNTNILITLQEQQFAEISDFIIYGNFQTAEHHLSQCIESLKYEPLHCPEGKLLERAREERFVLLEYIGDLRQSKVEHIERTLLR